MLRRDMISSIGLVLCAGAVPTFVHELVGGNSGQTYIPNSELINYTIGIHPESLLKDQYSKLTTGNIIQINSGAISGLFAPHPDTVKSVYKTSGLYTDHKIISIARLDPGRGEFKITLEPCLGVAPVLKETYCGS